jgi:soluble lytic murein transglycosylase-like protein
MKHSLTTLLFAATMALLLTAETARASSSYPYQSCFNIAARMHDVDVDLLLAVAAVESAMNADARSNKNAHGIMQIQWPGTARHLGVTRLSELYNPCLNIELGARYLRELIDGSGGDIQRALAAYNYGPGRIARSPQLPEGAIGYAQKVASQRNRIRASTGAELQKLTTSRQVSFTSKTRAQRFAGSLNKRITGASFIASRDDNGNYQVQMNISEAGLSPTDVSLLQTVGWNNLGASQ